MTSQTGRHIIITGASSGIGAAIAQSLVEAGWTAHACARRVEPIQEMLGGRGYAYRCDVGEESEVAAFALAVQAVTPTVHALVNCAGAFGVIGAVGKVDPRGWMDGVRVNLGGTYFCVHHFLPLLTAAAATSPSVSIINFSGGGAFNPMPNYGCYTVSKAGIVRLTENLAVELAPLGIRVNALAPGFVATPIHEGTFAVGPELAGSAYFDETRRKLKEDAVPMEVPVACLHYLLSPSCTLTGKTISANFDPWASGIFETHAESLNASDLYTMRRINLVNLPPSDLTGEIEQAAALKRRQVN